MRTARRALRLVVLAAAIAGCAVLDVRDARAQWCAHYEPMIYNCGFRTFEQCLANVTGLGGLCSRDRRYVAPAPEPRRAKKKRRNGPALR